jgi:hypothetical protein
MDEFDIQLRDALARKQAGRQAAQSFEMPQGSMVGGRYIRPSFGDALVQGLRMYQGKKDAEQAGQQITDLTQGRQKAIADALRNFGQQAQGAPENAPGDGMGPVLPAQAPDMMGAYQSLLAAPDSGLRQMGMQGMARIPEMQMQREGRTAELQARAEQRAQELQMQHQMRMDMLQAQNASRQQMAEEQRAFQAQMAAENRQHQQGMASLQASMRPERNVTVLGPNGEAVTLPQSQAQGLPLYNPQSASKLQKEKTKQQARDQLSGVVQQLNNSYTALEQGGGAVSTARSPLANIGARLSASGVGQTFGGALGTENQRHRQEIEQTRPLLLNLIKEATGMSAQQMNSNAEMQLYLQAATDPKLTVEANRSALANLDKMFGLGLAQRPKENAASTVPAGNDLAAAARAELERRRAGK